MKGLPQGVSASPATIAAGQDSTVVVLSAGLDASLDAHPSAVQFVGHARLNGHELVRTANSFGGADPVLQLVSVIPPPDVLVTTDSREVSLEPGKEATVTLHIQRQNGFKGRVPARLKTFLPAFGW